VRLEDDRRGRRHPGLPAARRFRSTPYNLGVNATDINRIAIGAASGFFDVTTNGGAAWTDIALVGSCPASTASSPT
jgi:hypothetical protein